ncbi:MAG: 30S ribosomal protein S17 [Solobacterium sp.]|jgi:small subunit ribosomal protein S17|nr:30S ribosomal protein S17 [Solobacterium sp.]
MAERNRRKVLRGTVVSDKMDKTIVVEINTTKSHPLYGRRVKYSVKFKAHDENNEAKIGDLVEVMETRPLSKDKHFRLVKIIEKAVVL